MMEILVNREVLLPVLTRGAGVVERRQTLPILGNLLLKAGEEVLTIVGTDLEVEVRGHCDAHVATEGEWTLPARKLFDIVRNLPEGADIRFKVTKDRCTVTTGRGRYVLGILPATDFPVMEMDEGAKVIHCDEGDFKRLIDKTAFAMAQQDVRYYLNGMLLEFESHGVRAVATDGHRLARFQLGFELDCNEKIAVIVPFKTVQELRRQLNPGGKGFEIHVGDKTMRFVTGGVVTTSKLVDGRYPDYERVIPIGLENTARIDKEGLKGALSRTSVLSNEKYRGVRLTFGKGALSLQAHNPEQEEAVEEMELEFDGVESTIGFNVAYLADVLGAIDAGTVEVKFGDGSSSSIWRGVGCESETFVVMPMRL